MAKITLFEFVVEGTGSFPMDMLRYDSCWPKTEAHDSVGIPNTFDRRNVGAPWRFSLVGLSKPTDGRWESFGWRVVEEKAFQKEV